MSFVTMLPGCEWPDSIKVARDGSCDTMTYVPERTCHDDYDGRQFRCSECGAFIHLLRRDDAFEWEFVYPDYCPFCGARVIHDA